MSLHTGIFVGTRIRTRRGDIAVEALRPGDEAIIVSGEWRPIRWAGRCTPPDHELAPAGPVLVRAGAFGAGLPGSDLLLAPDHALLHEMFLIAAHWLVNDATISRPRLPYVEYWQVELPGHEALLAEGLPVESFADIDHRDAWQSAAFPPPGNPRFGRQRLGMLTWVPPTTEEAPHLVRARATLVEQAMRLGYRLLDASCRVTADGVALAPENDGSWKIPPGTREVRLLSEAARPVDTGEAPDDFRRLGLCLAGMTVGRNTLSLDDKRLHEGFYKVEVHGDVLFRWTDGSAVLPGEVFGRRGGRLALEIGRPARVWQAPG